MIIVKCKKCGEMIHRTEWCCFCGNTSDFLTIETNNIVHPNVKKDYEKIEQLIKDERFDEAIKVSDKVLTWSPFCSDVFWLRLLAKNNCSEDAALIKKGFSCENSADFQNAMRFGNEEQRKVYVAVANKIESIKDLLYERIVDHMYSEKESTNISKYQLEFDVKVEGCRRNLLDLCKELKKIENSIATIERDCNLLVHEHRFAIIKAKESAATRYANICGCTFCDDESGYKSEELCRKDSTQATRAKDEIVKMQNSHPWIENYSHLEKQRDDIMAKINREIGSLREYEKKASDIICKIENIEEKHTLAIVAVLNYRFTDARRALGENFFESSVFAI